MKNKSLIYNVLNLKQGEGLSVGLLIAYSFFAGASLAFFVTSSTALFLNIFERDMLSVAFIAAGIIVWLVGQVFSKIQKTYPFTKSVTSSLAFLLFSIILFISFFLITKPLAIIFIIYAWIRVFAYIHAVTFWGIAGHLFSLRQAKRVFGLISGGEVLASIASFFSVPLLLKIISTEDLLLISGVFLFLGFLMMLVIVKKFGNLFASSPKKMNGNKEVKTISKTSFIKNRYYKLFFVIAFIPIFAQFFVDFIFQAQAKLEYPDKEALTSFVGIFFGISSIVEFILKAFVSGRLLSRYGIKLGLLAFPVVLAFSFTMATAFGFIYGAASLFFSFTALGRLFTRAVRTSFNDPATQILYQPLPAEERIAFQNKIESGPKAYASIVAGIFLFLFAKIPGFSLVYFSAFLLLVIAIWYKSGTAIYQEYRSVLQAILSKAKLGGESESVENPLLSTFNRHLKISGDYHKKLLLKLFRLIIPYETDLHINNDSILNSKPVDKFKFSEVINLSKSDNRDERIIAAQKMTNYSIYKVEKPLIRLLHDDDFNVKCEAVIASGIMKESELFNHILVLLQIPDYQNVVSSALVNIGEAIVSELDHHFQKTEYDVQMQLTIIKLVEKIGGTKSIDFLKKNIRHHNKLVSDQIIQALGKLKYRAARSESLLIWQKLENEIKNYVFVTAALVNVSNDEISRNLIKSLEHEQNIKREKIFSYLSVLYDPNAINLIAKSLDSKDKNAQGFALEVADMIISEMHKPMLLPLFESSDNDDLVSRYEFYYPFDRLDIKTQLADIINSEYWVTGFYTKCCAIEMFSEFEGTEIDGILIANMVHPIEMIRQLAGLILYTRNSDLFYKEVQQNSPKVHGLKEFSNEIMDFLSGTKSLIFYKLRNLKSLPVFIDIPEEKLIDIATSVTEAQLKKDVIFSLKSKTMDVYFVTNGKILDLSRNKILQNDSAICPFLTNDDTEVKFKSITENAKLLKIKLHYIISLMAEDVNFADKIIIALRTDLENENKEGEAAGIENVNIL